MDVHQLILARAALGQVGVHRSACRSKLGTHHKSTLPFDFRINLWYTCSHKSHINQSTETL